MCPTSVRNVHLLTELHTIEGVTHSKLGNRGDKVLVDVTWVPFPFTTETIKQIQP